MAAATPERFGGVNNVLDKAGIGSAGLARENTVQDWTRTLGVNLGGMTPRMRVPRAAAAGGGSGRGRLPWPCTNTASMAG